MPRPHLFLCLTGILILALGLHGPIAQPADYHDFADRRLLLGIPNAADVLSNLGFLLAGLAGLWRRGAQDPARRLFCLSLLLTAFGSGWYHLSPDDARLAWDRLPIASACAALLAGALHQAWPQRLELLSALGALAAMGVASVLWWSHSGDLGPYLLIQLAPLLLIPVLQWQSQAPFGQRKAFAVAILLYVLAKEAELNDHAIFAASGWISGHTLKHLLATLAALVLARRG